jgi:16S rRNA A1518/A1519 N6-dimethyltransferase RsmA/KsgA/DIM1 with predicted DNA glycosylase/AP lyase activity
MVLEILVGLQNNMKIEFNEQQLSVLNAAIVELPYRISAPLIAHINQQIKEQQMMEFDERRDKSVNHQSV